MFPSFSRCTYLPTLAYGNKISGINHFFDSEVWKSVVRGTQTCFCKELLAIVCWQLFVGKIVFGELCLAFCFGNFVPWAAINLSIGQRAGGWVVLCFHPSHTSLSLVLHGQTGLDNRWGLQDKKNVPCLLKSLQQMMPHWIRGC